MPLIRFPYGKEHLFLDIPKERLKGVLVSGMHEYVPEKSETELVRDALENPVGSPRLCELAKGKQKIVIIASDHTRPVPSKIIAPLMLEEIRKGNPDADITFLIATGCHRGTTVEELTGKFGEEIVRNEKIYIHDCDDESMLVHLGTLPSGGDLVINRLAAEADLLVSEGFIEPHFFAGFSGGRKSVLPGIAARKTVLYNHNAGFIASDGARTGVLEGNPIHEDMLFAARKAGLSFICNVVIDADKKVVHAVAGEVDQAHRQGREFLLDRCKVQSIPSDIVITSNGGYPLDQNIYQSVKGMTAAEASVNPGGVIIMLAKANDGHGGESFYRALRDGGDLDKIMESFLATPADQTIVDQWESQILVRVLMKATVIYLSDAPDELVRDMKMIPAHSLEEALALADGILKEKGIENAGVLAIPDGISVIVQ
ncbi:MAG: nickel-dependent lactate racemase [Oscillospiraceae bacterium]|nr:nickel-dependent lactate racemase [Oscillospiraceae bacterium]